MTATRSAIRATTPRLWVMRMMPQPVSRWISCISSRIWAWVVTSRAVVGSSARRIDGWQQRAIAIMTLCRWPPDIVWGYRRKTDSGLERPAFPSISIARFFASSGESFSWMRMASTICLPTRTTGFNEVIASWKIIANSFPR